MNSFTFTKGLTTMNWQPISEYYGELGQVIVWLEWRISVHKQDMTDPAVLRLSNASEQQHQYLGRS